MSLEHARKFVVDFDADPKLRIRIAEMEKKMKENNIENYDEMDLLFSIAKERGYNFTIDELKEANSSMVGEVSDDDLLNVAGGVEINPEEVREIPNTNMNDLLNMSVNSQ